MSIENATIDDLLIQVRRIEEHRRKGAEIEIKRCYQQLVKDLQEFLGVEYARLAEDDQLTHAILQQKGEQARFLEEVERKINDTTPKAAAEIRSVVNDVYAVAYSGMAEAVNTSTSTTQLHKTLKGLPLVSPEVVKRAVENPINKLTLNDRLERNRKDVIYNIKREIGTGLAQGDRMSTMAKRITEQVDIDYRKAMTITRTEVHRVQEAGHCDSARDISSTLDKGRSGMIMAKIWRTMQDESVRPQRQPYRRKKGVKARKKATAGLRSYIGGPNHVKMEGVTVKADELFDLGGGVTADTPGQSGVAGHDVNCRCYASYSLMTVAEFEKATGKSYEKPLTGEVDGGIMEETGEDNIVTKEVDLTDKAVVKAALDDFESDYKDNITSTTLVLEQKGSSRVLGETLGQVGYTDGYTKIISIKDIDFLDEIAINKALTTFETTYKEYSTEAALIISPNGKQYELHGTSFNVNTRLVGESSRKGSISIHNHPNKNGVADSFSLEDFVEHFHDRASVSWLVSGNKKYYMSYKGDCLMEDKARDLYQRAKASLFEKAMNGFSFDLEQLEIMRELRKILKGLEFNEF